MRTIGIDEHQTESSKTGQAINYTFTVIGLFLLVFLGAQAMTQLTDRAYVSGKPKVQIPFAMTGSVADRSVFGATPQSLVDGVVLSDSSPANSNAGKSEKDKAQPASEERSSKPVRAESPSADSVYHQINDKVRENSRKP